MRHFLICVLYLALISCTNGGAHRSSTSGNEGQATSGEHGKTPGSYQYCFVTADDTAILSLRITEGGVSGKLLLQYFGKERNDGKLENAYFRNDTLIADYQYWSDDGPGLREVMFLIRDGIALEGYGATQSVGEKKVFTSHKSVSFNSPAMSINGCGHKMPTFKKE